MAISKKRLKQPIEQGATICKISKEEAEWYLEFSNITRTETLKLPTWEEFEPNGSLIGNLQMYGATESLIKNFGKTDGFKLDQICRNFIVTNSIGRNFAEEYPYEMDWLREIIPTKQLPTIFWRDFLIFLNENGIYFMNQERKKEGV